MLGPLVEELYFRGYLLPRMARFTVRAPLRNVGLFAVCHLWKPWDTVTVAATLLPTVYASGQLSVRARARAPRLHRALGRVVLVCIGAGAARGLVLAPMNLAGPTGAAGFGTLAVCGSVSRCWGCGRAVAARSPCTAAGWSGRSP